MKQFRTFKRNDNNKIVIIRWAANMCPYTISPFDKTYKYLSKVRVPGQRKGKKLFLREGMKDASPH
jgi:hypothetical protein